MNIFEELRKLKFPTDEYMVLGSGILGALGIREVGDIDLLVTEELFEKCRNHGWKYEVIEIEGKPRDMLSRGETQLFKDFWWEGGTLKPEKGFFMAEKIQGINFIPLRTILEVKRSMKREKDLRDVVLIEEYIKKHLEL